MDQNHEQIHKMEGKLQMEKRILVPPLLDNAHIGQELVCHRPGRRGPPRMCVEERRGHDQLIGHNYGHGSSGWCLGPGTADYINGLLEEAMAKLGKTGKDVPVMVIGAGVIGLFTAYNLLERGFTRLTIMAEEFDGLPSHNAGGLLDPAPCSSYNPASQQLVNRCAVEAYKFYIAISRGEKPDFSREAAKQMPLYFDPLPSVMKPYSVLKQPKDVVIQFGESSTSKSHRMVVFDDNIFVNVRLLMRTLRECLTRKGVKFVQRKITSFDELSDRPRVMNCAGIGAKELCPDPEMLPIQGHLIMLKDQNPATLNYLIQHEFGDGVTKSGHAVHRMLYMYPKRTSAEREDGQMGNTDIGLIGGTFIRNCGPNTPNREEFELLLNNAKEWFGTEIDIISSDKQENHQI